MKILKLKSILFSLMAIAMLTIFLTSCEQNTIEPITENSTNNISKEILDKLEEFYLNTNNVKKIKLDYPDGTSADMYQVEGDIMLSEEQIMDFNIGDGITSRQYMSKNLVTNRRNIRVLGYTDGQFALSPNAQIGLINALRNFDNLGITFTLSFGTKLDDKDIVVYDNSRHSNFVGGYSGLPMNGKPYKWVSIYNLGSSHHLNEHVMTHEIGHCIGLRHTDWKNPLSCKDGRTSEPPDTGGYYLIPGTDPVDNESIMNSCIDEIRHEFSPNDIIALEFLYPM